MRKIAVCQFKVSDRKVVRGADDEGYEEQLYEYLLPEGTEAVAGHFVVTARCDEPTHTSHFSVAKIKAVKEIVEQEYEGDLKPIVAVFDTGAYVQDRARLKKREQLLRLAERKVAAHSKLAQLAALAGDDPEVAALLKEIRSLS